MDDAQPTHLDPFDVLEVTFGPDARPVRLDDGVTVVRTLGRHDGPDDAVLHRDTVDAASLDGLLADAAERFGHPDASPRVVLRADPALDAALDEHGGVRTTRRSVLVHDRPAAMTPVRTDLGLARPDDERAWHGVTVLHRHAGPAGDDRGRGRRDELLRWQVEGLATLVRLGRARVLRAERFGTPVGVGVLAWEPRIAVGPDHAGLAVLHGHVVHPAHRGLGIATTLAAALTATHLADFPAARVATVLPSDLTPAAVRRGWRFLAELVVVEATGA